MFDFLIVQMDFAVAAYRVHVRFVANNSKNWFSHRMQCRVEAHPASKVFFSDAYSCGSYGMHGDTPWNRGNELILLFSAEITFRVGSRTNVELVFWVIFTRRSSFCVFSLMCSLSCFPSRAQCPCRHRAHLFISSAFPHRHYYVALVCVCETRDTRPY